MYNVKHQICPKPVQDLFILKTKGKGDFIIPRVRTVNRGIESVRYRGPITWELVLDDTKNAETISIFQHKNGFVLWAMACSSFKLFDIMIPFL